MAVEQVLRALNITDTTAEILVTDFSDDTPIASQSVSLILTSSSTTVSTATTNSDGIANFSNLTPNTEYRAEAGVGTVVFSTLAEGVAEPITATQAQWVDLIDKVKTLQTSKVNAKKIQGSTSGVVYRKVTVVGGSSVYDGVGILLFSRQQRYLIDGMTATGYSGRCIEMGTNDNGTTATTSNRVINLKVYGVPESSRVEIYCRMSPYVYIDVHSTGTITIENSTESAYNNATDNSVHKSFLNRGDSIPETDVIWDGNTVKTDSELTPATMGCLDEFGHNRLAYLPAACLSFAFSRDGGSTWLDYTTANGADFTPTDAQKIQFVTYGNVWFAAGGRLVNSSSTVSNERLRIRIAAWRNKTGSQAIYGQLKQLIINMTSEGAGGTQCTIRYRTLANFRDNVETWVTYGSNYGLSGWSGWNSIPYRRRFGGSSTQTGQDGEIELVFWQTSVNSSSKKNMKVGALRAISSNLWNSPSDMASTGRLYAIDENKKAIFPQNIQCSDAYAYNLFCRNNTSWGNIGDSTTPWKSIYLNDGIYNGSVHLNLPTTAGTLALSSEIPTKVSELQNDSGYTTNTGTITKVQANGTDVASSGTANIPAATTSRYGVTELYTGSGSSSTSLALTPSSLYTFANRSIAPFYSASSTYAVGDKVRYGDYLYSCNTTISSAEAWNSAHWTQLDTLLEQVDDLISYYTLPTLNIGLNTLESQTLSLTTTQVSDLRSIIDDNKVAVLPITYGDGPGVTTEKCIITSYSSGGAGTVPYYSLAFNGIPYRMLVPSSKPIEVSFTKISGGSYSAGDNITITNNVIDTATTVPLIGSTLSSATSAYVDTDNIVNGAVTPTKLAWTEIIDKIYPVGSIYMSATLSTASAVSEVLGGTWVAWGAGRVPVGVDTSDTAFDTVEETGGSKTHSHEYGIWYAGWYGGMAGLDGGNYIKLLNGGTDTWGRKSSASGGSMTLSSNPATGGSNTPASYKIKADTPNSSSLQPYITCYMYKRTA